MRITVPLLDRRYFVPLVLLAIGVFFQLVVLPNSFPASHYDVLGLERYATVEKFEKAYEKLSSNWLSSSNLPTTVEFVKIRYAYELLTNGEWKRDYDLFAIDEQQHVIDETIMRYAGESYMKVNLPLLYSNWSGSMDQDLDFLTLENFGSIVGGSKAVLTMVQEFFATSGMHKLRSATPAAVAVLSAGSRVAKCRGVGPREDAMPMRSELERVHCSNSF